MRKTEPIEQVRERLRVEHQADIVRIEARIQEAGEDLSLIRELEKERDRSEKRFIRRLAKELAGDGPKPLRLVARDEPGQDVERPCIQWLEPDFHRLTTAARDRLLDADADIFERGGDIAEIDSTGSIKPIGPVRMRDLFAAWMDWRDEMGAPISAPELAAKTLCARPARGLRNLIGVIRTPTLRPDGSILETPGYDHATGLYYLPDGVRYRPMNQSPTREQAERALSHILEPLQDFPFTTEAHRAGAAAFLLTCVLRSSVDGVAPGFGFDAPSPGTGKTLLARMGGWIAFGREPAIEAYRHEEEEQEKRVTATLIAGKPLVVWDNIVHKFGSGVTDLLLTGRTYTGRVLGASAMPEFVNNTVWCFNGNNLRLNNADSIRRLIWVRMAYKRGDPTERTDFSIRRLKPWVMERRETLVRACVTLARYSTLHPIEMVREYASFEEWSAMIRRPIVDLFGHDPLDGFPKDDPDIHEESSAIATFYREWLAQAIEYNGIGKTQPKWTIVEMLKHEGLREVLTTIAPEENRRSKVLGELFKRWKERPVMVASEAGEDWGCWRMVNAGKPVKTGTPYQLEQAE